VGVFDSLKGMAKDAMEAGTTAAGGAEATGAAHEESAVAKLLGAGGGQLPAILEKLNVGGLGDVAKSWIGKGQNQAVSADQVKASLPEQVSAVASKLGISQDEAAAKIAQYLPTIIDKLTPDGLVPDPDALAKKVSGLLKL
jgi:uncharacterized protein YidB (DUF937 family)